MTAAGTAPGAARGTTPDAKELAKLRRIAALRSQVAAWRRAGESVAIVPTMGALHDGHLALVRRARSDCDRVITTIFVNPMQFNRRDDLSGYPRDEAGDAAKLAEMGVDVLFAPAAEEVYPEGYQTRVSVPLLSDCLCGAARPGHMEGVATVVAKLLLQSLPDAAYFGEKDYQQLLVIRRMARDLDIPVRIEAVATVREADGLALSSRNLLLTPAQRDQATAMYRVLSELAARLKDGRTPAQPALAWARAALTEAGFDPIDYLELRGADSLQPLERAEQPARLFAAAWLGQVRLIDNLAIATGCAND
ncbi:pantoate--beta-alanine ligase [Pelagibius litoralis]|uniref:Pantothenate synthetase n=1 Tax=Pelagibius litoralis TaxID=374515 RepID=A0A967KDV9_9PROT|nr:pantoate--beta-alanine ligase [Pelagibius litoralis]NIA71624.1 pantoate--beta-alanine ligase [Pelagibius litoralis]